MLVEHKLMFSLREFQQISQDYLDLIIFYRKKLDQTSSEVTDESQLNDEPYQFVQIKVNGF